MKSHNKIQSKSMKSHQNLDPNLTPKYGQIHRKSAIFEPNSWTTPYSKLRENH